MTAMSREQLLAAESVGEPAEEQRTETRAQHVDRGTEPGHLRLGDVDPAAGCDSWPEMLPTIVTSRPSSIQTVPSPITIIQCHRDQGSRSRRAGTLVVTAPV